MNYEVYMTKENEYYHSSNEEIFDMLEAKGEFIDNRYYSLDQQFFDSWGDFYDDFFEASWEDEYQMFIDQGVLNPYEDLQFDNISEKDLQYTIKIKDKIYNKRRKHINDNLRNTWFDTHRHGDRFLDNREHNVLKRQKLFTEEEYTGDNMNEELYAYDHYLGYDIYIEHNSDSSYYKYWGNIYENGICFKEGIKSSNGERCLDKCKFWVEGQVDFECL